MLFRSGGEEIATERVVLGRSKVCVDLLGVGRKMGDLTTAWCWGVLREAFPGVSEEEEEETTSFGTAGGLRKGVARGEIPPPIFAIAL